MTKRDERSEPERVWARFRGKFGDPALASRDGRRRAKRAVDGNVPFSPGRDPLRIAAVVDGFAESAGWTDQLAEGAVVARWPEIVGEETSRRTTPIGIEDHVLLVQCSSTSWAQQLRLMRGQVTTRLIELFPDAHIESVRFIGPDVPNFQRGIRSVRGRGPRDTWG
ncbi:DUF721 domain-containing protein [Humidisolicoccus flavus]|uniref:DUF721 domain-containing protein n=1 Tax=Humidisolicoccus flavus TaxID=3111414 RepID=UPI003249FB76